jgi:hypothetical protein
LIVRKGAVSLTQDDVYFPIHANRSSPGYLRLSDAREAASVMLRRRTN